MQNNLAKSYLAKPGEVVQRWHLVDAEDQVLGRLAAKLAVILMGKHRPTYTPHVDTGEFVVVVNADKVKFTGNKWNQKTYQRYSHYTGGQKVIPALEMLEKKPEEILRLAVKRMMPRGPLAYKQITKLKIFAGPAHEHQAQKPIEFKLPTA